LLDWSFTAMVLSITGVVYASCIAIVQKDFKRLIAYSSIAHVGLISAGLFSLTAQGIQGGIIQSFSHGINVVGLFFIVDILYSRTNTYQLSDLGGIRSIAPRFATLFVIILLGSVALPLTNGFVGEFLLLNGIFQYSTILAGLTIILGAVYMLGSFQKIMLGESGTSVRVFADVDMNEKIILFTICGLILLFGVYPKPILNLAEPAVTKLMEYIVVVR
jgi:NADH-quinone oxidoreductase subunit M